MSMLTRLRRKSITPTPEGTKTMTRLRFKSADVSALERLQTKSLLAPVPCCAACGHGDCCETPAAQDALAVLDHRGESAPAGFSYKFAPNTFALDSPVIGEYKFSDKDMAITYVFAAAQGRDRDGDYMEIGPTANGEGILTANHERNAVAYIEHGQKFDPLPIGMDRVRVGDAFTGPYTVVLDAERGLATCTTYLTQSRIQGEQVYAMYKEGLLRGGSIGYRPIKSVRLAPDPAEGHFTDPKKGHAGLHLLTVELLETTLTAMPMNADAVRRSIEMGCCGRPLAPGLKSMLVAKAAAAPIWSPGGWEGKTSDWAKDPSHHASDSGQFTAGGGGGSEAKKPAARLRKRATEKAKPPGAVSKAVQTWLGDGKLKKLTPAQLSVALDSLNKYPTDYGLTSGEAFTIQAAFIGINHGLETGRLPGAVENWWREQTPAQKLSTVDEVIVAAGTGGATDDYYNAFRKLGIEATKPAEKPAAVASAPVETPKAVHDDSPMAQARHVYDRDEKFRIESARQRAVMDLGKARTDEDRQAVLDKLDTPTLDVVAQTFAAPHLQDDPTSRRIIALAEEVRKRKPQKAGTAVLRTKSTDLTAATVPAATPEPPHAYASTHFAIPEPFAGRVRQLAAAIPDADLAEDGRSLVPHITARYGIHTADVSEVIEAVRGCGPVLVTLGATTLFPASETAPYDVVKIDVESYPLRRLHRLLGKRLENTRTHPRYRPHLTIATVAPGKGAAYTGPNPLTGATMLLDRLIFSDREGTQTEIALTGVGAKRSLTDAAVAVKSFDEGKHPRADDGKFGSGHGVAEDGKESTTDRGNKETAAKKRVAEEYAAINSKDAAAYREWEEKFKEGGIRLAGLQPKSSSAEYVRLFRDLPGDAVESVDPAHDEMFAKHLEGDTWLLYDDGMVTRRSEHSLRIILGGEIKGHDAPNHALTQKRIDTSRRLANDFPTTREGAAALELTSDLELVPAGSSRKNLKLLGTRAAEALWEGLPHELAKPRTINGEKVWVKRINDAFAVISDGTNQKIVTAKKARVGGGPDKPPKPGVEGEEATSEKVYTRLHVKAIAHAPAGSPQGGQFTSGPGGGAATAKPAAPTPTHAASVAAPSPQTVLAGLPKTAGHLARAKHALGVAKDKAIEKLQRLSALIISADAIPIASDFAREALLKGAGQSNALHGVPLQDVANIATRALAWAWTKVKGGKGTGTVKVKSLEHDDTDAPDTADAVLEIVGLLHEMMGLPSDTPLPSREEIEKALAAKGKGKGTSRLRRKTSDPDAKAKAVAERLYGQLEARYGQKTAAQIVAAASETPVDNVGAAVGLAHVCTKLFGAKPKEAVVAEKVYTRLRFKTSDWAKDPSHHASDSGQFTAGGGGAKKPAGVYESWSERNQHRFARREELDTGLGTRFEESADRLHESRTSTVAAAERFRGDAIPAKDFASHVASAEAVHAKQWTNASAALRTAGATEEMIAPLTRAHEKARAELSKITRKIEKYANEHEEAVAGIEAALQDSPAEPPMPEGDDAAEFAAWEKLHDRWEGESGKLVARQDRFEEKKIAAEEKIAEAMTDWEEASRRHADRIADLQERVAGKIEAALDREEAADPEPVDEDDEEDKKVYTRLRFKTTDAAGHEHDPNDGRFTSGHGGATPKKPKLTPSPFAKLEAASEGTVPPSPTFSESPFARIPRREGPPSRLPPVKRDQPKDFRDAAKREGGKPSEMAAPKRNPSVLTGGNGNAGISGEGGGGTSDVADAAGRSSTARGESTAGGTGAVGRGPSDGGGERHPETTSGVKPPLPTDARTLKDLRGVTAHTDLTPEDVWARAVTLASKDRDSVRHEHLSRAAAQLQGEKPKPPRKLHEMTPGEWQESVDPFNVKLPGGEDVYKEHTDAVRGQLIRDPQSVPNRVLEALTSFHGDVPDDIRKAWEDRVQGEAMPKETRTFKPDQMTRDAYTAVALGMLADPSKADKVKRDAAAAHRFAVRQAIRSGQSVPSEVLADYPDLVAKAKPKSPTTWPAKSVSPSPAPDPLAAFREQGLALGAAIRAALERSAAP